MIDIIGGKYLITTDDWFFAPDGEQYKAVFGTVSAILTDSDALGVKTNDRSTNWYVSIGNMLVAGCQIHYAIRTNKVSFDPPAREIEHAGRLEVATNNNTRVYNADVDKVITWSSYGKQG